MATHRPRTSTNGDARPVAGDLVYSSDETPGIRRRRSGRGWSYYAPGGLVRDAETLKRIRALAVPPAWTDVWISPEPRGHIQATGRDARGRKQYRYHADFRAEREEAKYGHLLRFARCLPKIRAAVDADMGRRGLPRERVLATIVRLLELTFIRVGNDDYATQNGSYGLTTLRNRHVRIDNSSLRFRFKGKSGKLWDVGLTDRRVARIVRRCQDLPGQELFQYLDDDGAVRHVSSADVNAYLRAVTGEDVTAKDFRTWAGTVLAAVALSAFEAVDSDAGAKKNVRAAIERVAARLGNTPAICRKCYVHPEIVDAYFGRSLLLGARREVEEELRDTIDQLDPTEAAVLAFLHDRLDRHLAAA
jgi:DNA topoisomerase-1